MTVRELCGFCGKALDGCLCLTDLLMLSTHYAHEVVIARDTEPTEAGESEKIIAYVLVCLEFDQELIYTQTNREATT